MKVFISYSHKDADALERLHTHLAVLQREGKIQTWHDREILAGSVIDDEIAAELEQCDLFLPLVSPDFLASNYCYEQEMAAAIERHAKGVSRIVPIIVEPCDWLSTPLQQYKALPKDGKPVSDWKNTNTAYLDVVNELRRIIASGVQAAPKPNTNATSEKVLSQRYRVKRKFDKIDCSDFRDVAFKTIRDYFEASLSELDEVEDIRARFKDINTFGFTCTILNKACQGSAAHLTVHARNDNSFGDISFSHSENAPSNTSNGGFSIESDDYDLFLKEAFSFSNIIERLTPTQAAKIMWDDMLERVGVSYV